MGLACPLLAAAAMGGAAYWLHARSRQQDATYQNVFERAMSAAVSGTPIDAVVDLNKLLWHAALNRDALSDAFYRDPSLGINRTSPWVLRLNSFWYSRDSLVQLVTHARAQDLCRAVVSASPALQPALLATLELMAVLRPGVAERIIETLGQVSPVQIPIISALLNIATRSRVSAISESALTAALSCVMRAHETEVVCQIRLNAVAATCGEIFSPKHVADLIEIAECETGSPITQTHASEALRVLAENHDRVFSCQHVDNLLEAALRDSGPFMSVITTLMESNARHFRPPSLAALAKLQKRFASEMILVRLIHHLPHDAAGLRREAAATLIQACIELWNDDDRLAAGILTQNTLDLLEWQKNYLDTEQLARLARVTLSVDLKTRILQLAYSDGPDPAAEWPSGVIKMPRTSKPRKGS